MTKNQQEAIERACGHENLLADLVYALKDLQLRYRTLYRLYANAGAYTIADPEPDIELGLATSTEVLARATSQDVK